MIDVYDELLQLDDSVSAFGVSPLAYVMFDCAR